MASINHPRWLVERPSSDKYQENPFEDVGAFKFNIDGGCLIFTDAFGKITVAYAVGQWLTVVEND